MLKDNKLICRFREWMYHAKYFLSYYVLTDIKSPVSCVIANFDVFMNNFGLTDRLRNCLSLYLYCRRRGLDFKIVHNAPFRLEEILEPNACDWRIDGTAVSRSMIKVGRLFAFCNYKSLNSDEEEERKGHISRLDGGIKADGRQYHVFGNMRLYCNEWSAGFDELFKPSPALQERIDGIGMEGEYDAAVFRFRQLLGDFVESYSKPLPAAEQSILMNRCITELKEKYAEGYFQGKKVLVTSDSIRFLNAVEKLPFVRTIPGRFAHPSSGETSTEAFIKSFVDLYALKNAETVTLFKTGAMYESGFPEFAACIGNGNFRVNRF